MIPLIVLAVVLVIGLLLATDRIGTKFMRAEVDGYPVPMIVFAVVAAIGIVTVGLL